MDIKEIVATVSGIAWPIGFVLVVIILRDTISSIFSRIKDVEGPTGWKILFEMRKVGERLGKLESVTTDIYNLSGESQRVRDEIFEYIADILNNVSESTAIEMKTELNKYHFQRLPMRVKPSDVKSMLSNLGFYKFPDENETKLDDDITQKYINALYNFQTYHHMRDADGIIGPKTIKLLLQQSE
jgi:hypothetical protein